MKKASITRLVGLSDLYGYIYAMIVSQSLTGMPIFGGALFMSGRVTSVFAQTFSPETSPWLPRFMRVLRYPLMLLMLLLTLCLTVIYPLRLDSPQVWLIFSVVLSLFLRDAFSQRLGQLCADGRVTPGRFDALMGLVHGVVLLVQGIILLYNLPIGTALMLLLAYLLCSLAAYYATVKHYETLPPRASPDDAAAAHEAIRSAHALTVYEWLSGAVLAAMEMTLVVMYTFLAATAEQLVIRMALAVLTTLVCRECAEMFLAWRQKAHKGDPTNLLIFGLFLWVYGLWIFSDALVETRVTLDICFLCLALCSVGSALCAACLTVLESSMHAVAAFTTGGESAGYRMIRAISREWATLLGQLLALAALTALCFLTGGNLPRSLPEIEARFQPVMVLPALLTALTALLCVLRFPLSSRYLSKVRRFLHIREAGEENPALEKQLTEVVIHRHVQPFAIRALMALLRPFFRHRLQNAEAIHPDESNPIVFLCNHGEVYGPVAGMLYVPVPVRPWVISDIAMDPMDVSRYIYRYTFSPMKWLGPLRWPISRLLGPVSVWAMKSLECVPVFRNKPRELMTTFRKSVEAMQAGDNLLIFPENPDADPNAPGYEHGRPGDLFRGFPMLAQVYYNRTGKRCRFLPMLAHKDSRTITFGSEIVYDPDANPIDERDRIVEEASAQMQRMFEAAERRLSTHHDHSR